MYTNLTELENKVVIELQGADHFEGMPCDCIENLKDNTGLSTSVLRGVLTSLQQKGYVSTGEYPNGMTAFFLEKQTNASSEA